MLPKSLLSPSPGPKSLTSWLYPLEFREEVFSETHLQVIERLCTEVPKTPRFPPYIYTSFALDIVGADIYTGRGPGRHREFQKSIQTARGFTPWHRPVLQAVRWVPHARTVTPWMNRKSAPRTPRRYKPAPVL